MNSSSNTIMITDFRLKSKKYNFFLIFFYFLIRFVWKFVWEKPNPFMNDNELITEIIFNSIETDLCKLYTLVQSWYDIIYMRTIFDKLWIMRCVKFYASIVIAVSSMLESNWWYIIYHKFDIWSIIPSNIEAGLDFELKKLIGLCWSFNFVSLALYWLHIWLS